MKKTFTILFAVAVAVAVVACDSKDQPGFSPAPSNTQPVPCPKIGGSFFGADKAAISKGESVTLSYKVPWAYGPNVRIEGEGIPQVTPPEITDFKAGPSNSPLTAPTPPEWDENRVEGVRPQKTTTFVLNATGPSGCEPLELKALVKVSG